MRVDTLQQWEKQVEDMTLSSRTRCSKVDVGNLGALDVMHAHAVLFEFQAFIESCLHGSNFVQSLIPFPPSRRFAANGTSRDIVATSYFLAVIGVQDQHELMYLRSAGPPPDLGDHRV